MAWKLLPTLKTEAICAGCGSVVPTGGPGWWKTSGPVSGRIRCVSCGDPVAVPAAMSIPPVGKYTPDHELPTVEEALRAQRIGPGVAGASAQAKADSLHLRRSANIEKRWGRLSGVVKFLTDDPQSTKAWAQGASGERQLAESLNARVGDRAVLLNDRSVPKTRGNIDHIAISPSGVWVIDAKNYKGKVERRNKGVFFAPDYRIYVNGRDRTKFVGPDGMGWQLEAVRSALVGIDVPVRGVICFTDAEWGLFSSPIDYDGVLVTWPRDLAERVGGSGEITPEGVLYVGELLFKAFPAMRIK